MEGRNEEVTEEMEATGEGKGGGISLHALIGCPSNKIIKVEGQVRDKKLMILIDSGSTHSFLNEKTTKDLGCDLQKTFPLSVTVANGNKVYSKSKCADFSWEMQGEEYITELWLLKLDGCNIVLGVDWMQSNNI